MIEYFFLLTFFWIRFRVCRSILSSRFILKELEQFYFYHSSSSLKIKFLKSVWERV